MLLLSGKVDQVYDNCNGPVIFSTVDKQGMYPPMPQHLSSSFTNQVFR